MLNFLIFSFRKLRTISYFLTRLKWKFLGARIGKNTKIRRSVVISYPKNCSIGNKSVLNQGVFVSCVDKVTIGNSVQIAPYVCIYSSDHAMPLRSNKNIHQKIVIGEGTWVGVGAVILKGVKIGKNVTVGANSVVTKNIPDNAIVVGAPAKVVGWNNKN